MREGKVPAIRASCDTTSMPLMREGKVRSAPEMDHEGSSGDKPHRSTSPHRLTPRPCIRRASQEWLSSTRGGRNLLGRRPTPTVVVEALADIDAGLSPVHLGLEHLHDSVLDGRLVLCLGTPRDDVERRHEADDVEQAKRPVWGAGRDGPVRLIIFSFEV